MSALPDLSDSGGKRREKLLVRVPNWIGDAVMSVAALRELRRFHPDATISLLARPWVAGLLEGQGLADEIIQLPARPGLLQRFFRLPARLHGFDRALLLQNAFSGALAVWLARIPERHGYRTDGRGFLLTRRAVPNSKRLGRHQVFHYLDLLYQCGLSPVDYLNSPRFQPDIRLKALAAGRETASRLLREAGPEAGRRRVAINPGAFYGPAKRWFPGRYADLADRLIERQGVDVLLVGSVGERPLAEEIASKMAATPRILTGRTDLPGLMAVLADCALMITNDSGPMHLAAALGTPQIALFGSTDEVATGPLGGKANVVHKHVPCSPCLLRECPIDLRCFDRITVDEVFGLAVEALGDSGWA